MANAGRETSGKGFPETAQGVDLKYSLLTTCRTAVLALRIKRNSRRIDSMEKSVQL
jgi:hypothetical protein